MRNFLDFEKPIADLEGKIEELKHLSTSGDINIAEEVGKLQSKVERQLQNIYQKLTPWQTVQVARHPDRPHVKDILAAMISDFMPLAGDRAFGDDAAVIGGLGRFRGRAVMVIGTEKGRDTDERLRHNFGMARPEGYRKAQRLITLANRFGLPVLTFVDTAGAYPGVDAEERGQAEAIARTIEVCLGAEVPIIVTIVGEGLRRGRRPGRRRLCDDAGKCGLFGDFAGRLRVHPVAERGQRPRSRRSLAHDCQRLAETRRH